MADVQKSILLQVNLNIDQLKAAAQQAQDNLVKLKAEKQQLIDSNQKDTVAWAQNAEAIRRNNNVLKQTADALNIVQKQTENYTGSLKDQSEVIKAGTITYNNYTKEQQESDQGKELKANLDASTDSFRAQNAAIGNFTPNIGNYNKSLTDLSKGIKGLGGLGVILSSILGIDPRVAEGIRQAGVAIRDYSHAQNFAREATQASTATSQANTAATEANKAAQYESALATEAAGTASVETTAATEAGTVATEAGTIATNVFARAWKAFTVALAENPWTAILVGAAALGTAIYALYKSNSQLSDSQQLLNDINKDAIQGYDKEIIQLNELYSNASDLSLSYKARQDNIDDLKKAYPELLSDMTVENANNEKYAQIINEKVIPAIKARALAQAAEKQYQDANDKYLASLLTLSKEQQDYLSGNTPKPKKIGTGQFDPGISENTITNPVDIPVDVEELKLKSENALKVLQGFNKQYQAVRENIDNPNSGNGKSGTDPELEDAKIKADDKLAIAVQGSHAELVAKKADIEAQRALDVDAEKKSEDDAKLKADKIKLINDKANVDTLAAQQKFQDDLVKINQQQIDARSKANPQFETQADHEKELAQQAKDAADFQKAQEENDKSLIENSKGYTEQRLIDAENEYAKNLQLHAGNKEQLLKDEQDYNDKVLQIKLEGAKAQLELDKFLFGANSKQVIADEKALADAVVAVNKNKNNKLTADDMSAAEKRKKTTKDVADASKTIADAAIDVENNNAKAASDYKKQVLDKELAAKSITQSQYDTQTKKLQHDDAVREKQVAEEKIIVNTAVAIVKALTGPPGEAEAAAIAAGIEGAAELAVVESASIPFAEGGRVLPALNGLSGGGKIGMNTGLPISRSNGDNRLSTLKTGEVVLTEDHQRKLGGARTFAAIGVPGFSGGGGFINSAVGREGLPGMGYGDVMNMIKSMPPQVLKISDLNFIQGRATKIQDRSNF